MVMTMMVAPVVIAYSASAFVEGIDYRPQGLIDSVSRVPPKDDLVSYKFGIHLMVWSGQAGARELALLPAIKELGYDGVEIPIFDPDALEAAAVRAALAQSGLACTASTALPEGVSLIDADIADAGVAWLERTVAATAELGAPVLCGPLALPVGERRATGYTEAEWALRAVVAPRDAQPKRRVACLSRSTASRFFLNTLTACAWCKRLTAPRSGCSTPSTCTRGEVDARRHPAQRRLHQAFPRQRKRPARRLRPVAWAETFALRQSGYVGWSWSSRSTPSSPTRRDMRLAAPCGKPGTAGATASTFASAPMSRQPNIILIMTDQQRRQHQPRWAHPICTRPPDRLAGEGVSFAVPLHAAVCVPSARVDGIPAHGSQLRTLRRGPAAG